jgi:hypothetical protein
MTTEDIEKATMPIPDHPDYRVGRDGSIWSRPRKGSHKHWKKLKPWEEDGYLIVRVRVQGGKKPRLPIHRTVLRAFKGEPPEGKTQCCHLNGNSTDNRLENLYWGNDQDQIKDRVSHGTINRGERAGRSRLTENDVNDLRGRDLAGEKIDIQAEATKRGVRYNTIWEVLKWKTWKHVNPQVKGREQAPVPARHQNLDEDDPRPTPLEELLKLWSRLTECEQQEFLLKIQRGWE